MNGIKGTHVDYIPIERVRSLDSFSKKAPVIVQWQAMLVAQFVDGKLHGFDLYRAWKK